jgi:putative nucleotidyltransferase with HDIG domain
MNRFSFLLRERLADVREWIDGRTPWRFELVLLACLVVGLTALICSHYLPTALGLKEGNTATRTIVAEKTVTVLDQEATDALKARVAALVAPVYLPDTEALPAASDQLQGFWEQVVQARQQAGGSAGPPASLETLEAVAPESVSRATLEFLLTVGGNMFEQIQSQTLGALETVYASPITEDSLETARTSLRGIADQVAATQVTADAVYEVTAGFLGPNQVVDEEQTEARREAAMAQVAPVLVSIEEGETVLERGEIISAQDMLVLRELGVVGTRYGWNVWLGTFLLMMLEAALFSRLLRRFNKTTEDYGNNILLVLALLLLGATAVSRLLIIEPLSAYLIPVAALGMTVAMILNARSALLMVVLLSLNIGLLTDLNMRYPLVAIVVGGLALYFVSRVTKRMALLGAGLAAMILAAFTIFAVELFTETSVGEALRLGLWGLASGALSAVLAMVLLSLLESVFNLTTSLRLLELADPAHPLLKKLLQVAPGTYNHSIQMGTLAEGAAEAIGANPLLARVGAYYHDIGKTVRPDYFVENQIYVDNPHEHMSPNLSKLAITAHVRDGEHLGRVYGLPKPVVDIIKQHHGTSVLAYFYHKAMQAGAAQPGRDSVYEESYRYEEQKPQSKEAAIIMLADSVEAAVRAMENPTRRKIQGVIQEVIKQKVQDGQLDESALTQGDLHKIRDSFDQTLLGLVGHRIRYPDSEQPPGQKNGPGVHARRPAPPSAAVVAGGGIPAGGGGATTHKGGAPAPSATAPSATADGATGEASFTIAAPPTPTAAAATGSAPTGAEPVPDDSPGGGSA